MTPNILFHMHNNLLHTFCLFFFFFHYYLSFSALLDYFTHFELGKSSKKTRVTKVNHLTTRKQKPCLAALQVTARIESISTQENKDYESALNCSAKWSGIDSCMSITSVCIQWPEDSTGGNMTMSNCILGKITKFIFHKVIDEFKRIRAKLSFSF